MKKFLSVMLTLVCLMSLVSCGGKSVDSGDANSRYPYSWTENSDGTITLKIRGKWRKDHAWRAEYDETILTCTPEGKKGRKFTIGSLEARTAEIDFRLYGKDTENYEYDLWLCVQGNGSGGVIVLASTSLEGVAEGSYSYETDQDGSAYFHIYTRHTWDCRVIDRYLRADVFTVSDNECVYRIAASRMCTGVLEFFDTQAQRTLLVSASAGKDGTVTVKNVEEGEDTAFSEKHLARLWEQLGVTFPISEGVEVQDCSVSDDPGVSVFPCGELDVVVNEEAYTLVISMGEEWMEEYLPSAERTDNDLPESEEDAEDAEGAQSENDAEDIPQAVETEAAAEEIRTSHIKVGQTPVTMYTQGKYICAVWKQYGANFLLDGRDDINAMEKAVRTILGEQT